MKMFISLVLASTLALKLAEGVAADLDQECDALFGCNDDNAECVDRNGDGSTHCHCAADFRDVDGQCTPKGPGQLCESDGDCGEKGKCTVMEGGVGKCERARASSVPASVVLIMAAVLTSGFWWSSASFP